VGTFVQLTGLPRRPVRQPVFAGCTRQLCDRRLWLVTKIALEVYIVHDDVLYKLTTFTFTFTFMYSKSDKCIIDRDSSHIRRKKAGELWLTNYADLDVESNPPKLTFSEDHILALKGCCAPKFLHVLENDQVLLADLHCGQGSPLQFF